jgi:hypothetical protein
MIKIKHKVRWTVLLGGAILAGIWLVLYVLSGPSEAIELNGPLLLGLRKEWMLDGSPETPSLGKYTANWSDSGRFFVWTNVYSIDHVEFKSLFGIRDPKFENKGMLVVSRDGKLIWVSIAKSVKLIKMNFARQN